MNNTLNELMGELLVSEPGVECVLMPRKGLFRALKQRKSTKSLEGAK